MKINAIKSGMFQIAGRFKNLLLYKKQGIAEATLFITLISILSRVVGYFREVLVAKYFGASGETDAFLVAMIIPTMVTGIIANGISTLIIPFYVERKEKDPESARSFVNQIFYLSVCLFSFASLLTYIFAPLLTKIIAPGFDQEKFGFAVEIGRYLIPLGFAMVFTGFFTGIYSAQRNFLYPAIVALIGNALIAITIVAFAPYFGINSWTIGQLAYAAVSFFALFAILWHKDKFFRSFSFKKNEWPEIKRFAWLLVPMILSSSIFIVNQIADKVVASYLEEGSIAILNFAQRIYSIPINLFVMPLLTAIYPAFSSLTVGSGSDYQTVLRKTLFLTWYLLIPISVIFIIVPEPVIKIIFEHGAFTASDTRLTALSVSYYSIGLFAYATNHFLVYLLYSLKNTRAPLVIGLISVAMNIAGNLMLARIFGVAGIALATALSSMIGLSLYRFTPLRQSFEGLYIKELVRELLRIIVSCAPVAVFIVLAKPLLSLDLDSTVLLVRFFAISAVSLAIYVAISHIYKLEGYAILFQYTKKFLKKTR